MPTGHLSEAPAKLTEQQAQTTTPCLRRSRTRHELTNQAISWSDQTNADIAGKMERAGVVLHRLVVFEASFRLHLDVGPLQNWSLCRLPGASTRTSPLLIQNNSIRAHPVERTLPYHSLGTSKVVTWPRHCVRSELVCGPPAAKDGKGEALAVGRPLRPLSDGSCALRTDVWH